MTGLDERSLGASPLPSLWPSGQRAGLPSLALSSGWSRLYAGGLLGGT